MIIGIMWLPERGSNLTMPFSLRIQVNTAFHMGTNKPVNILFSLVLGICYMLMDPVLWYGSFFGRIKAIIICPFIALNIIL